MPTTPAVLLVDDTPGEVANFAEAFDVLTHARTLHELDTALAAGRRWAVAFVDFNLGSPNYTGLSALLRLRHERPQTRLVAYSQLGEGGRTLYACAARHWFEADALLDKVHNESTTLRHYVAQLAAGRDPTPAGWQQRLTHAELLDDILAEPYWLQIWRALHEAAGEMQSAAKHLNRDPNQLRGFKDRATQAVIEFNFHIHDLPRPLDQRNKKGLLSTFAARHWQFLGAPDLSTAMSPTTRGPGRDHRGRGR